MSYDASDKITIRALSRIDEIIHLFGSFFYRGYMAKKQKNNYPFHFRRYKKIEGGSKKKAKHPKLIVDEDYEEFVFMGLTESEYRGHHKNIPLSKNPQKGRSDPAYIRDELRRDSKTAFGSRLPEYNLSRKDREMIAEKLLQKRKKK